MGQLWAGVLVLVVVVGQACVVSAAPPPDSPDPHHSAKPVGPWASESDYAAVLALALDTYEAEVVEASARWYPSYTAAYETSQRFITPDLRSYVGEACRSYGLAVEALDDFAAAHPGFVTRQNQLFDARVSRLRPAAFAIMGRIDPDAGR